MKNILSLGVLIIMSLFVTTSFAGKNNTSPEIYDVQGTISTSADLNEIQINGFYFDAKKVGKDGFVIHAPVGKTTGINIIYKSFDDAYCTYAIRVEKENGVYTVGIIPGELAHNAKCPTITSGSGENFTPQLKFIVTKK